MMKKKKNHFNDSHYGSLHVVLGNLLAFVSSLYAQTTTQLILVTWFLTPAIQICVHNMQDFCDTVSTDKVTPLKTLLHYSTISSFILSHILHLPK